ncbi:MAG: hypothetical protein ACXVEF_29475 [Polyangiales bacterium]
MTARLPALPSANTIPTPAQWALARMLDAAFDDPEAAQRCVELALKNASRRTIPESLEELLQFGREHLVPVLAEELGPRIVAMLFEDLTNELGNLRRSEVRFAPTPRAFRRPSTAPRITLSPASEVPPSSGPSLNTIQSPAPRESLPAAARPVVAIVEGDRWRRAPIARALVQGGCDVLPLDSSAAALDHLPRGHAERIDVVVMEIVAEDDRLLLRQLVSRFPSVRVIAWTEAAAEEAGLQLTTAGLVAFAHLPRAAAPAQVAEAARRLV